MKVTDKEIMTAVTKAVLKSASYGVLHKYIGGGYSVCGPHGEWNYEHACHISSIARDSLGIDLSMAQSLKRIRALIDKKQLVLSFGSRSHKGSFHYGLPGEKSISIFERARAFWIGKCFKVDGVRRRGELTHIQPYEIEPLKADLVKLLNNMYLK